MRKTKLFFILVLLFVLTGCNTVAGVGKDIQGSAEWTKDKIAQPKNASN